MTAMPEKVRTAVPVTVRAEQSVRALALRRWDLPQEWSSDGMLSENF